MNVVSTRPLSVLVKMFTAPLKVPFRIFILKPVCTAWVITHIDMWMGELQFLRH
jgi:hypothetical protein